MSVEATPDQRNDIRARIKRGEGFPYAQLRQVHSSARTFALPLPLPLCRMAWAAASALTKAYYWAKSAFLVTPLYRGLFESAGRRFRGGTFIPFVEGRGRVRVGDDVKLYGKQVFLFAAIRDELPSIAIGDRTTIGHNVVFDIAGKLTIGTHCMIASNVLVQDCSGHPLDAEARAAGMPPMEKDVRDITLGDNVWIGTGAYILPGADIGNNCVIAANTVVARKVPDNSLVYTPTAKAVEIRDLSKLL